MVLLHAAQFDRVPLVVNLSGRFDMTRGILAPSQSAEMLALAETGAWEVKRRGRSYLVTQASIDERRRTSMHICAGIRAAHILTIHGDADDVIPYTDSQDLHAILTCRQRLVIVAGAGHNYSQPEHAEQVLGVVSEFLLPHFGESPTPLL